MIILRRYVYSGQQTSTQKRNIHSLKVMVGPAKYHLLWVDQIRRDDHRSSIQKTTHQIEQRVRREKTTIFRKTSSNYKISIKIFENTTMKNFTPPAVFFRHWFIWLPFNPIDNLCLVWTALSQIRRCPKICRFKHNIKRRVIFSGRICILS